jgi:holo-[acyl-carrier protein] synthase
VIHGIGTDIFEVARMAEWVARGTAYLETIFTQNEIDYCETKKRKSEHYAARYAAKEAVLKALGTGWRGGLAFTDIEILNDEMGRPVVALHGKVKKLIEEQKIERLLISLSHTGDTAMAVAILEK